MISGSWHKNGDDHEYVTDEDVTGYADAYFPEPHPRIRVPPLGWDAYVVRVERLGTFAALEEAKAAVEGAVAS